MSERFDPALDVQRIVDTVSSWDGITALPHRFGGVEFNLGQVEIGHIHRHGMVDIPFTRKLREALVSEGLAETHHLLDESGWITLYLREPGDADRAIRLYRLSLLQKRVRRDKALSPDSYESELAGLVFPVSVIEAMPSVRGNE